MVDHYQVSLCVWKSETCLFVWDIQHDFFLAPPGHLEKFCVPPIFLHVLLHLCNSCTMLCCTLLYGIDLCSRCIHVCNSPEIHVLPFSCFCIQHTQCISFVSGVVMTHCIYSIFFFLLLILQCVQTLHMCLSSCNIFWATISHADCGILFSKSYRSKVNATQSSLNLFAFWGIISCLLMYDLW